MKVSRNLEERFKRKQNQADREKQKVEEEMKTDAAVYEEIVKDKVLFLLKSIFQRCLPVQKINKCRFTYLI